MFLEFFSHTKTKKYQTSEWKSLDEVERAQLLLVLEGLKRGTIIEENLMYFKDFLEGTGLVAYEMPFRDTSGKIGVIVATPEDLLEAEKRHPGSSENADVNVHKSLGWLLGYPICCIDEYVKYKTQNIGRETGRSFHKFYQELTAKTISGEAYPDLLDYRPRGFVPCGIECPKATNLLIEWKEAIDALDPEAGRGLVYFNRRLFCDT